MSGSVRREPGRDGKILSDHRQDGVVWCDRFTCKIVTYAKELTSVYICYSTGDWF